MIIRKKRWKAIQKDLADKLDLINELSIAFDLVPVDKLAESYIWFPSAETLKSLNHAKHLITENGLHES